MNRPPNRPPNRPVRTGSRERRSRGPAVALSLAAHLAIGLAMLSARAEAPGIEAAPEPILVSLVEPPPPPPRQTPAPTPDDPGATAATAPVPTPKPPVPTKPLPVVRPTPKPPLRVETVAAAAVSLPAPMATLGEAQLVGARTAGSGSAGGGGSGGGSGSGAPGGACDMVGRLQAALREDPEVRAALTEAYGVAGGAGRALLVWNGDWVRNPGQAGKGLAGVRQAIMLEIAFAPPACRAEPVRGLVLISLADGPAAARMVMGSGTWRWSDLLSARR